MEQGQNQEHGWEHYAQAFVDLTDTREASRVLVS